MIAETVFYTVGTVGIALTIVPFFRHGAWWIRIGDFPRLQIAGGCALISSLFLIFYSPVSIYDLIFITGLSLCVIYQSLCILPYSPLSKLQVERSHAPIPEKTLKLYICNVLIENRNTRKLKEQIRKLKPDIVVLSEPDDYWAKELEPLHEEYPIVISKPLDNAYGLLLFSKFQLINPEIKFLVEGDVPSIHADVMLPSGDKIKLYCLHPRPPVPREKSRSNERDAELMIVGGMINKTDAPTIVCGDLNDVAWSYTTRLFQKISGLLDPRIGRGLYNSFQVYCSLLALPLDHIFHSNHFRLVKIERLPSVDSDHFPIYISLSLEQTAELTQEKRQATAKEHKAAFEIIQQTFRIREEEAVREVNKPIRIKPSFYS